MPNLLLTSGSYKDTSNNYVYYIGTGKNYFVESRRYYECNYDSNLISSTNGYIMGKDSYHSLKMRLYDLSMWNIYGELILNLIPCSRDSDSSFGFYDTVSEVYNKYLVYNYWVVSEDEYGLYYELKYPATSTITVTATAYWDDGSEETVTKTINNGSTGGWRYYQPQSINITEDAFQKYTLTNYWE